MSRREGFEPLPSSSEVLGLYIGACAAGSVKTPLPDPSPLRRDDRAALLRPGLELCPTRRADDRGDGRGWIEIFPDQGVLVT
ncbi:hypothetical protein [Rhizobium herbae]|uniref:hypothetical protein n=1 Tax=Rhizobium herbae TaxID=508661 RepID=UPI001CB76CA2|nr:hypothetical protein [Rhizobium herbae]